ncbi:DUF6053 domain-containing protein [Lysobacter enzymogenes]|uniref:DUF6053 domain-containing protein n=1 Tax=Lysobacter enzymogenes TaxID=69 RepID=UPI00339410EC
MRGPSGPMPSAQPTAICNKSIGPERPPTRAPPRTFLEGLCANANAVTSRPRRNAAQIAAIRAPQRRIGRTLRISQSGQCSSGPAADPEA